MNSFDYMIEFSDRIRGRGAAETSHGGMAKVHELESSHQIGDEDESVLHEAHGSAIREEREQTENPASGAWQKVKGDLMLLFTGW